MCLSKNIRQLRLQKNMTQEQLASSLNISAQAVSKWETGENSPDSALLLPLAHELGVSLDELFSNKDVFMADISKKIISLMKNTHACERLNRARDIGWQIERGLFSCLMELDEKYNPDELKNCRHSSYIINDYGFTLVSNGRSPFFAVFPEPEEGYGETVRDGEEARRIFECLSSPETMRAIIHIHKNSGSYIFERDALAAECGIEEKALDKVINDLLTLNIIYSKNELNINNQARTLYFAHPSHKLIALILMAHELNYHGYYSLTSLNRNKPYLK